MEREIEIDTVSDAHIALGLAPPKHPLVSIIKNDEVKNVGSFNDTKVISKLYSIVLKKGICGDLKYGVSNYDFQSGTLLFTAPNQVIQYDNIIETKEGSSEGWNLIFHPDLIRKSNLSKKIREYSFFEYRVNEGLHLSENEKETIEVLITKVVQEYEQAIDKHSQHLISLNIELLLDYCV
ncbi:MAG: AraC family transcriptional regulator, partial [Saprospiraceae bacterium]